MLLRPFALRAVCALAALAGCMPVPNRPGLSDGATGEQSVPDDAAPTPSRHRDAAAPVPPDTAPAPQSTPDARESVDEGAAPADAETTPTFDDVAAILDSCSGCHARSNVVLTNDDGGLYARLTTPNNKVAAGCNYKRLVVPNHPETSLLYLKLAGTPPANCGVAMPKGAPRLPADLIATIQRWILAGAPK